MIISLDVNNISTFNLEIISLLSYSLSSEHDVYSSLLQSGVNTPDLWIQRTWKGKEGFRRDPHTSISTSFLYLPLQELFLLIYFSGILYIL